MNKQELHANFKTIFDALNNEQKSAVEHIYGPVMVIAGPGTGKTQILSARIANILLQTDYIPDNILCLTYTDAGRVAMRQRLQEMIGADAYRVAIHTFHSFCSQIISDNPSFFNKPALDPISELERIEILKKLIDNLSADNPLKRFSSKPYLEVKNLSYLFDEIKKEGYTPVFIREKIKEFIDSLPNRKEFIYQRKYTHPTSKETFEAGDLKRTLIQAETKKFDKMFAAIDMFEDYQKEMDVRNRYDFNDMINWVLKSFEEDKNFLADFKEQFQFILVDEYQDTSGTQNKLIHFLVEDEEQPNLFVVGDDDQSIYRFQGANIDNIYHFQSHFGKELKEVVLVKNYRSSPTILETAQHLIANNVARMVNRDSLYKKDLISSHNEISQIQTKPVLQIYENPFQELVGVAEQIERLIEQGENAKEIAVLYKENWLGIEFLSYLKEKNIPYYLKRKEELFDIPLAKKLFNIIRYLAAEREVIQGGEALLFEILHYDLFQIPAHEIVRMTARIDNNTNKEKSLRVYLQDWISVKNKELFQAGISEEITEAAAKLENWIKDSYNIPFMELVEKIIREGKFLQFALASEEKLWFMEVLRAAMDYVKEETHRNPKHTPESFISTVDLMIDQEIKIPMYRVFGTEYGVNLLTVHGSKGLEFKHVFMIQTTRNLWEERNIRNKGFKFPDTILSVEQEQEKERKLEETRRLFYVALTRAKVGLTISWSQKDNEEKPLEPSQFIAEITDKLNYEREQIKLDDKVLEEYLNIYLFKNKKPVLETGEADFVEHQLRNFSLSPTALNNYLNCPLRFYYNNIVRVPAGRNEFMAFGSAVHHALEYCFKKMQDDPLQAFPPLVEVIKDYHWYLERNKESFTPEALQRRKEYGEKILSDYYTKNVDTWNKVVSIEKRYRNIVINGVPVNGMIDKIEFNGKNAIVVDYKTGKSDESKKKTSPPSDKEPNGSDYWRQAMFYKLLVDNDPMKDWNVQECVFQFIEPNKKNEYPMERIVPTAEHLDIVRAQMKDTYEKIMNYDFYTGCGKDDCHACNFVKENNRYIQLEDVEAIE